MLRFTIRDLPWLMVAVVVAYPKTETADRAKVVLERF
jgi:hypothetical protein